MNNKERGLIKGGIRRVFSRSELRRSIIDASRTPNYSDGTRPRVTKWSLCKICDQYTPTYLMEVDHSEPIVPLDRTLEDMSWDEVVNRVWCDPSNLKAMCKPCHKIKTGLERKQRALLKKKGKVCLKKPKHRLSKR